MQSDYIVGCNLRNTYLKCRLCKSDNVGAITVTQLRVDIETELVGINGEFGLFKNAIDKKPTDTVKNVAIICKQNNIKPGRQNLMNLIRWQTNRGIMTFHQLFNPDYLHTVLKGVFENVITWTIQIIKENAKLDKRFDDAILHLDNRLKYFPYQQSLRVTRDCRFGEGISKLFKTSTIASADKGTGFMYGSIEAWKLVPLLFQLLWCINDDIIPLSYTDVSWQDSTKRPQHNWGPGRVIINTIVTVLEFHFCMNSKLATVSQIESIQQIVDNVRTHIGLLWLLHKDLLQTTATLTKSNKQKFTVFTKDNLAVFQGIKHHLLSHIVFYSIEYGIDHRFTDTNLTEGFHKICVKELFERTSKRKFDRSSLELLINYKKKLNSKYLTRTIFPVIKAKKLILEKKFLSRLC